MLNLEESIAVTQNFVSRHNLKHVLEFLRRKKNKSLFNSLVSKLKEQQPAIIQAIEEKWAQEENREREKVAQSTFWQKLKNNNSENSSHQGTPGDGGAFSFGFNFEGK